MDCTGFLKPLQPGKLQKNMLKPIHHSMPLFSVISSLPTPQRPTESLPKFSFTHEKPCHVLTLFTIADSHLFSRLPRLAWFVCVSLKITTLEPFLKGSFFHDLRSVTFRGPFSLYNTPRKTNDWNPKIMAWMIFVGSIAGV